MPWIIPALITGGTIVSGTLGANAAADASDASSEASRAAIDENRRQFQLTRADTAPYRDIGRSALYELAGIFGLPGSAGGGVPAMIPYTDEFYPEPYINREATAPSVASPRALAPPASGDVAGRAQADYFLQANAQANNPRRPGMTDSPAPRATVTPIPQTTPIAPVATRAPSRGLYDNLKMDPGHAFRLAEGEKALQRMQSAGGTRYGGAALKSALRYNQDFASNEFSNAVNRRNAELGYLFSLAGFGPQGIATAGQAGAAAAENNSNILMQNAQMQGNAALTGASAINNAVQGGIQNYYTQNLLRNYNRTPQVPTTQRASIYNDFAVA